MAVEKKLIDKAILKTLVPCDALSDENLGVLASKTFVTSLRAGEILFKAGQCDSLRYYLLSGELQLEVPGQASKLLRGEGAAKHHALGHSQPRQVTAITKSAAAVAIVDEDELGTMLTWDQSAGYTGDKAEDEVAVQTGADVDAQDDDWMTRILQTKSFYRVPPANIQAMFMRLQPVSVQAGEAVVKQGDPGDYYYIVSRGRCKVTRKVPETGVEIKLTELRSGDSFGEESLLGDSVRNATVTMLTDGALMRLSRADFEKLLKTPVLKTVNFSQAQAMVKDSAVWLDVRLESEYQNENIPGSINVPLYILRLKMAGFDPAKRYVIYCDSGARSSSATFLMSERGFDVYLLEGGLTARNGTASAA